MGEVIEYWLCPVGCLVYGEDPGQSELGGPGSGFGAPGCGDIAPAFPFVLSMSWGTGTAGAS